MNKHYYKIFSIFILMISWNTSFTQSIEIGSEDTKFIVEKNVTKDSPALKRTIQLPSFEKGTYYRPYSGGVATGNRVEAVAFNSLEELQNYEPPVTRKGHGGCLLYTSPSPRDA